MPMLRKVSLDLCDAKDGDYDIPEVIRPSCSFLLGSFDKIYYCSVARVTHWFHLLHIKLT